MKKRGSLGILAAVLLTMALGVGNPERAWAAGKEFFADSAAVVGRNNDKLEAESRAQNTAQALALQQIVSFLESQRDVVAARLGKEDIQAVAQELTQLSVVEKKPVLDGSFVKIMVRVKALIEMDQVKLKLNNRKLMEKEKMTAAVVQNQPAGSTPTPPVKPAFSAAKATPEEWLEKGHSFLQAKDYDHAIAAYKKALEINPRYADAHNSMGSALYGKVQYADAAKAFQQAILLDPKDFRAHYNAALAYERLGQMKEAAVAYRKFIEFVPTYGFEEKIKYATERIHKIETDLTN